MTRPCEVCSGMTVSHEAFARKGRMRRVVLEGRIVALCQAHALIVTAEGVDTVERLRACFGEPSGQRSLVDRRSPLERRILPPRPELRRRNFGRRSTDPIP